MSERARRGGRRWLKRAALAVVALVALVLLLVVGALAFLQTGAGERIVLEQVLSRANQTLSGSLELGEVDFRGDGLRLRDVVLKDPEGEVVARIGEVELELGPSALLRKRVHIELLRLVRPELHVVKTEEGTNLQLALEPREPKKPEPEEPKKEGGKLPVDVLVDRLEVVDGLVSYEEVGPERSREVRVEDLDAAAALSLLEGGDSLDAELDAHAQLAEPRQGPIELTVRAEGEGARRSGSLELLAAGAELKASGRMEGEALAVELERLVLPPELARALSPEYPLVETVRGTASVKRAGSKLDAEAHLRAGSGRVDAQGDFDLDTFRTTGVTLEAKNVDLAELVEEGPKSDLHLTVKAEGGGRSLETLDGSLRAEAPPSTIEGTAFGPIDIAADAKDGHLTLHRLLAKLPGVALSASGEADRERVDLRGEISATDLGRFGKTLGRLAGPEGIPVRGNGRLSFSVTGPLHTPAVEARGRFPSLAYAENRIRGLRLEARVPNVQSPLDGDALVDLRAGLALIGDKRFDCPALRLSSAAGDVSIAARARGFIDVFLSMKGEADEDGRGLALRSMVLRYPEARWTLERAAHLRFEEGRVGVEDLALRSGRQRLALDLDRSARAMKAHVNVDALDLALLPKAFVEPELDLRGQLSADVRAEGRADRPAISAKVSLEDGQFREYRDLHAAIDAGWKDDRATGKLDASGVGLRAHGTFDVPVRALQSGARARLRADLKLEDFSLDQLARTLKRELPARGIAGATIRLRGTARDPELRAEIHGRELVLEAHPPIDLDAVVRTDDRGRLVARVDAKSEDKPGFVMVETPWTLGRLIRSPPTAKQAMRAPIALTAKFDGFPIPVGAGNPVLDLDADLRGAALDPRGKAELRVKGLQSGDLEDVDAWARLRLDGSMRLDAKVAQGEVALLKAEARVGATVATLMDPRSLPRVPVSLDAEWGPIGVMEIQGLLKPEPPLPGEQPPPILTGLTRGKLAAKGTLENPELRFETTVHGMGSAQSGAVGDVSLRYTYADATHDLQADLLSGGSGRMVLRGRMPLDVSWSKLRGGLDWQRAPLDLSLDADGFDPQFLAGAHPKVLRLGGRVDANVRVVGSAAVPSVDGRLEWSEGVAAIAGSGEYREIHLLVTGTEERVRLEELVAKGGEGKARLTGEAVREGDERLRLTLKGDLDEFPIITEDQLAATVSLEADASGTAGMDAVHLAVKIPDARVELPSSGKRDLQKLDEPEDVVFVRNGEPVREEKAPEGGETATATGGSGEAGGAAPEREIRVDVDAPRNLWVSSEDMNVEVGLSEGFRVIVADAPQIFGEVQVIRGRLEVFGRRFDFERESTVAFGGPVMEPRLNVVALHENDREDVTVTLKVEGTAEELKIQPTSDPPLPETEIYTLLATGRRSLRPGTGSAGGGGGNAAMSALGGLAAAQLKKGIEEALPLDVLSIEPGERGIAGTRVEAGTYVTDRLYLGVETQLGAQRDREENNHQLNVEYQLWKRWMMELEYGDARQGNADLIWRKQY